MQRKGFTLVEIMIVVAIIGILIAIAVPGFLRAREISRRNACQENQSKLDGAVQQYILEWRLEDSDAFVSEVVAVQPTNGDPDWLNAGADPENPNDYSLIGEGSYIRFPPTCPSGGVYSFNDLADIDGVETFLVACELSERANVNDQFWHVYPGGETATPVAPAP